MARIAVVAAAVASAAVGLAPGAAADGGDLDPGFGDEGTVTTDLRDVVEEATAVEVLPGGDILVATKLSSFHSFSGPLVRYDADGAVDTAFGESGMASTEAVGCVMCGNDMAIQPDGKIVVAGASAYPFLWSAGAARFNADGTPDTGFGRGGVAGSAHVYGVSEGVALQSDGKILLVSPGSDSTGAPALVLLRLRADGTPDTAWGPDGVVRVSIDADPFNDSADVTDVVVQPDGKIIAAATRGPRWGEPDPVTVLARLQPDGTLDTGFGNGGLFETAALISPSEVALQPDGKIVAVGEAPGETGTDFAVIRVDGTGTLDASFGDAGRAVARPRARGASVAVRPDGRIVAVGDNSQLGGYDIDTEFVVAMYLPDGSLDPAFGDGGLAVTDHLPGTEGEFARDVALQPDGKIVVVGQTWTLPGERDVTLDRYLVNTPPTVAAAGGACAGDSGADVRLAIADAETPAGDLLVTATSSDQAVIADAHLDVGAGQAERILSLRPDAAATGHAVVTVTVDDGEATATVPVEVTLGGRGADSLAGSPPADVLLGRHGDDMLSGGDGADVLCGGRGDDTIAGDAGADHLGGDRGNDLLTGGPGADQFSGGGGTDTAVDVSVGDGDEVTGVP